MEPRPDLAALDQLGTMIAQLDVIEGPRFRRLSRRDVTQTAEELAAAVRDRLFIRRLFPEVA